MPSRKGKRAATPNSAEKAPGRRRTSAVLVEDPMLTTPTPVSSITPSRTRSKSRSAGSKGAKAPKMQESAERASEVSGLRRSRRTFSRLANARMQGQAAAVDLFTTREKMVEVVKEVLDITDVTACDGFMGFSVKEEPDEVEGNGTGSETIDEEKSSVESSDSEGLPDVDEADDGRKDDISLDRKDSKAKADTHPNRTKTNKIFGRRSTPKNPSDGGDKNAEKLGPCLTPVREQDASKAVADLDGYLESVNYFGAATPDCQTSNGVERCEETGKRAPKKTGASIDESEKPCEKAAPSGDLGKKKSLWEGFVAASTKGVFLRKRMNIPNDRAYDINEVVERENSQVKKTSSPSNQTPDSDAQKSDSVQEMDDDGQFFENPFEIGPLPSPHAEVPAKLRLKRPFPESPEVVRISAASTETDSVSAGGPLKKRARLQPGCTNGVVEVGQEAENDSLTASRESPETRAGVGGKPSTDQMKTSVQALECMVGRLFPVLPLQPRVCTDLEQYVHHPAFIRCSELLAIGLPRPELAGLNPVVKRIPPLAESCPMDGEILEFSELMGRFAPADVERSSGPPATPLAIADNPMDSPFSPVRNLVGPSHVATAATTSLSGKRNGCALEPASPPTDDEFPGFGTPNAVQRAEGSGTRVQDSEQEKNGDVSVQGWLPTNGVDWAAREMMDKKKRDRQRAARRLACSKVKKIPRLDIVGQREMPGGWLWSRVAPGTSLWRNSKKKRWGIIGLH